MEPDVVLRIGREALLLALLVCLPPVLAAMAVGLLVSLLQAATQIQEQTLTFVPKLVVVCVVLAVLGLWMLGQITQFTTSLMNGIPELIH